MIISKIIQVFSSLLVLIMLQSCSQRLGKKNEIETDKRNYKKQHEKIERLDDRQK